MNLQRKIIKGGTYKNWRLDGEFIANPFDSPTRFDILTPGDYAIIDFEGDLFPTSARVVFVAGNLPDDANLHRGLSDRGIGSMAAIDMAQLRLIVHASGTPELHPVNELLLDSAIEDAAQSGIEGTQLLLSRSTGRRMTRGELERARQRADDVGRMGEELIDEYLSRQQAAGVIRSYEWVSADNAIAPLDFAVMTDVRRRVEVKSTCGDFNQVMHISLAELIEMRQGTDPYDLYRVYALDDSEGSLRIACNLSAFATHVLRQLEALPSGVTADSISVRPQALEFGPEVHIDVSDDAAELAGH